MHLDHQDFAWLGGLLGEHGGIFEPAKPFGHPETDRLVRTARAWSLEPSTQTAIVQTAWEELDENGQTTRQWKTAPIRLHCLFRFEMEHLLARTGFEVEALFGDFYRQPLMDKSESMIWVTRRG